MKKNKLILLVVLLLPIVSNAQMPKAQAAFIYALTKYMQWPSAYNKGNFVIGVFTDDPIVLELQKIASRKKYINQNIEIKVFKSIEKLEKTHILFIPAKEMWQMKAITSKISRYRTLIIGNHPEAIRMGAGINFVAAGSVVNYEVKSINIVKKDINVLKEVEVMASKIY